MIGDAPFILLDDARETGAGDVRLFTGARAIFVARRPHEVAPVLEAAEAARASHGGTLAGYLAYEAGLALEQRLASLAPRRTGAAGPLAWFGLFDEAQIVPAADMPGWLADNVPGDGGPASIGPLDPQIAPGEYLRRFGKLAEAIRAGDIYQANLTLKLAGAARGHPLAIYAAIRPAARAGFGGVVFDGSDWLLSFSPELFFEMGGGDARCVPMKGTRPRGATADQDRDLARQLATSAKDKAENLMIVDLMRNDLARVAEPGSVRVENAFAVETYPTLHAMTTNVRASLRPGMGALDMLRALFPCGSITGTPKIRAMELIDAVEDEARGPYCGAIGHVGTGADGKVEAAFNVAIRTIRLIPGENQRHKAVLGVGGAIVADSDGMAEWRECLVKGGFARGEAGGHDLVETMRFEPGSGVAMLDLHLDRLRQSAAQLGFAHDGEAIAARLAEATGELSQPVRLRLLLARGGAIAVETAALPDALPNPVRALALPHPIDAGDWRLRHKTTDRGFHEAVMAEARRHGAAEAVLVRDDGLVTEGSWTNVFVEREGMLLTPPLALGLLPGVLRRSLIETGRAREEALTLDDLAGGFLIGNALRGLMPAVLQP